MKRTLIAVIVLTVMSLFPSSARAHKGHDHTVMGTISSIQGKNLMVKTADGKETMVMLDANSKITRGKAKVELSELKIGDRVVATGPEEKEMVTAKTLKIGDAPAAKTTTKAPAAKTSEKPHTDHVK
jgi:hypothetical protein